MRMLSIFLHAWGEGGLLTGRGCYLLIYYYVLFYSICTIFMYICIFVTEPADQNIKKTVKMKKSVRIGKVACTWTYI